ncbi:hypothetical protein GGQ99_005154 [Aminobacter niigataensis]|uniref:N,N-dimethylformamidase alpha subunit domain-containing protein n=1 Tax=Aminobacter niigataensis TaxID=83265 RepID=A0ABR6L998_9HYPH|nr:inner-membrane translocator [Aminobacter niigataensis]MBB4653363.1 hypothetical protein [Aminobacter niigataensis]
MHRNATSMSQNASWHATDEFITLTHVMPILWDEERRQAIIDEHRENPIGKPGKAGKPVVQHSNDLARVLDKLRRAALAGKEVRVEIEPFKKYAIGILPGKRGEPVEILEDQVYATGDECEHAIFLRRVKNILDKYPSPKK